MNKKKCLGSTRRKNILIFIRIVILLAVVAHQQKQQTSCSSHHRTLFLLLLFLYNKNCFIRLLYQPSSSSTMIIKTPHPLPFTKQAGRQPCQNGIRKYLLSLSSSIVSEFEANKTRSCDDEENKIQK